MAIGFTTFSFGQYSSADTTALGVIRDNNFSGTTALSWTDSDPGNWIGVVWDSSVPKRVITLNLSNSNTSAAPEVQNGWRPDSIPYFKYILARTGTVTDLTGTIDVTALTNLENLMLKRNLNITGLNVSGLTNLKHLFISRTAVSTLDLSGLTSLIEVHANQCSLTSVDLSGCNNLKRASIKDNTSLTTLDVSGCTSMVQLVVPEAPLSSLNLSGLTQLWRLKLRNCDLDDGDLVNLDDCNNLKSLAISGNNFTAVSISPGSNLFRFGARSNSISSMSFSQHTNLYNIGMQGNAIPGHLNLSGLSNLVQVRMRDNAITSFDVSGCNSLVNMGIANNMISSMDLVGLSSLLRVGMKNNDISSIVGGLDLALTKIRLSDNALPITLAAQWNNHPYSTNNDLSSQFSYSPETILVPDSIDFSPEDSIDINGTMASTTFELFTVAGASQGTNATGIFNLTAADTGCYYVELTNSGTMVISDTICVIDQGAIINTTINVANFGNVTLGDSSTQTVTISNSGNIDLNVSNISLPAGFISAGFSGMISSGNVTNIDVVFKPSQSIAYSGVVSISSNAVANAGNSTVGVSGVGVSLIGIASSDVENQIEFYPNPTSDVLFIQNHNGSLEVLNIYSVQGVLVKTISLSQNITSIDFTGFESGIYFIRSVDGGINQKILKN